MIISRKAIQSFSFFYIKIICTYAYVSRSLCFLWNFFLFFHTTFSRVPSFFCFFLFLLFFFAYVCKRAWLLLELTRTTREEKKRRWKRESRSPFVRYHHCRSFFLSCVDNFTQFFLSVCVCLSLSLSLVFDSHYTSLIVNARMTFFVEYLIKNSSWKKNTKQSQTHDIQVFICVFIYVNVCLQTSMLVVSLLQNVLLFIISFLLILCLIGKSNCQRNDISIQHYSTQFRSPHSPPYEYIYIPGKHL